MVCNAWHGTALASRGQENIKCRTQGAPGMATLKPLLALKSSALKSLAVSLGVNSTGTKSQLASQIISACCETVSFFERPALEGQPSREGVPEVGLDSMNLGTEGGIGKGEREKKKNKRVLSIDMGIRNLAMCVLEVPVPDSGSGKEGSKRKVAKSLPKLLAWERVTVAKKPVAEEPLLAPPKKEEVSPEKLVSKSRRSLKKVKVAELLPFEGELGALKQEICSEQITPKSKSRSKKRATEAAEDPPKKEKVEEEEEKKEMHFGKGNEATEVVEEVLPEDKQKILQQEEVCSERATPKNKRGGEIVAEEVETDVCSGEATAEGTDAMEASSPSKEQEGLEPKQIYFGEAIPDGKSRSRKGEKASKASLSEEERKALKQEDTRGDTRLGGNSRSRKGRKVMETQSPEELVSPISILHPNLGEDGTPKKGGRVKRKPKKKAESFEPSVYALLANTFVHHLLNRFSPLDAVLIERQRYRSSSAAAIQEWTVRVNMLEAMLHAVFCCLHGKESPAAESVNPHKVARFWIDKMGGKFLEVRKKPERRKKEKVLGEELGVEEVKVAVRGKTNRKTKLAKVLLVREWLRSGDVVSLGKDVIGIASDFEPVKGRRKANMISEGKLDDLADCLLQGMAWIRWEENRKSLAEGKLIPEFIPCANSKS